jgi:hypothetical protein
VSENRVLRIIFTSKREEVEENEENYIIKGSVTCSPHQTFLG